LGRGVREEEHKTPREIGRRGRGRERRCQGQQKAGGGGKPQGRFGYDIRLRGCAVAI